MNNGSRQQIVTKPKNGSAAMALLLSGRAHLLLSNAVEAWRSRGLLGHFLSFL